MRHPESDTTGSSGYDRDLAVDCIHNASSA